MPKGKPAEDSHRPLDQEQDFNTPTVEPESTAAHNNPQLVEEQNPQLELPGTPEPDNPKVIRDGKMLAKFVRPHFEKEEDGDRYVGFEFAIPLTKDHEQNGHLPSEVLAEWDHMKNGNSSATGVRFNVTAAQTVAVGLMPGDPDSDLILVAAAMENSTLQYVNESGSGKRQQVIRLSFRAVVDQTEEAAKFAVDHHGDDVWISIQRTQGSLIE